MSTENEENLINLINKLSEFADDEATASDVIDGMVSRIRSETAKSIQSEMDDAKKHENDPLPEPRKNIPISEHLKREFGTRMSDETIKMLEDVYNGGNNHCHCHGQPKYNPFYFTRIREVKAPVKAHPTDAGIDFFVPEAKAWDDDFKDKVIKYSRNSERNDIEFTDKGLIVLPNSHVAIPSGIKTIIPQGLGMMFVNKSGVATKMKLDHSACLVDSEYRDEIIMCFFNHNTEPVLIEPGMKITQGLIVPIINLQMSEVLNCVYDDIGKGSDRGGGFGSSGTK